MKFSRFLVWLVILLFIVIQIKTIQNQPDSEESDSEELDDDKLSKKKPARSNPYARPAKENLKEKRRRLIRKLKMLTEKVADA